MSNKSVSSLRLKLSPKLSSIPKVHPNSTRVLKSHKSMSKNQPNLDPIESSNVFKDASSYFPDWLLKRKDFRKFLVEDQSYPEKFLEAVLKPESERTANDLYSIINWFKHCKSTQELKEFTILKIAKNICVWRVNKGDVIDIQEFENQFVLVVKGTLSIYKNWKKVGSVGPRTSIKPTFGFSNDIKVYKALTDVTLVKICEEVANKYLFHRDFETAADSLKILSNLQVFSSLGGLKLAALSEGFIKIVFRKDEEIYKEGDESQYLFLIYQGEIQIQKNLILTNHHKLPIRQILVSRKQYNYTISDLQPGEMLGFDEIISNQNYFYTATCKSKQAILFAMPKSTLTEILTPKDIYSLRKEIQLKVSSREIKERLKSSISSGLLRIKTIIETTERSDSINVRNENKKRTWANGVSEYSSLILPHLVSEEIEFKKFS